MAIVVASMATHSTPRLSASTARHIAARNRHTRAGYDGRPGAAGADRGSADRPQDAVTADGPTIVSMHAESASTRNWPPSRRRGLSVEHGGDQHEP